MKLIVNVETSEETLRELNPEELEQQSIDLAFSVARQEEEEAKATARQAILDRLGLTAEEAALILG